MSAWGNGNPGSMVAIGAAPVASGNTALAPTRNDAAMVAAALILLAIGAPDPRRLPAFRESLAA